MRNSKEYRDVPKSDGAKGGKFNAVSEKTMAYKSMAAENEVRFFSATTVREKCDHCTVDAPCCEARCSIFDDRSMQVDECKYCPHGGDYCYTASSKELDSSYSHKKSLKEFTISDRMDRDYTYDDIDNLHPGEKKLLLSFRFVNEYFKYLGREELIFRYKKSGSNYRVKFAGEDFEVSRNKSVPEIFEEIWQHAV